MCRILIVDDEEQILRVLDRAIRQNIAAEVVTALTATQAESVIRDSFVDVVLADLRLTDKNGSEGLQLLGYVKDQSPKTRIVIMTGYGSPEIEKESYSKGAAYYVEKPIDVRALIDHLLILGVASPITLGVGGDRPIEVMLIGHSPGPRQFLSAILSEEVGMRTLMVSGFAAAFDRINEGRPDVILLDLAIPHRDTGGFIRKVIAGDRVPIVAIKPAAERILDPDILHLVQEGALTVISTARPLHYSMETALDLIQQLRRAVRDRRVPPPLPRQHHHHQHHQQPPPATAAHAAAAAVVVLADSGHASDPVVAIGASTGGTEAVARILAGFPPGCPAAVVALHMPDRFIGSYANRLRQTCRVEVREARDGDEVRKGTVLIAPGNRQLYVRRVRGRCLVKLAYHDDGTSLQCPSLDLLFGSVAEACGPNAVGVILTGTGTDGAEGLLAMKRRGAATIAQDEATCVVFGMPGEAVRRGAAGEVCPLEEISERIMQQAAAKLQAAGQDGGAE